MVTIHLDIVTLERTVVSEDVDYVSAPGIDGVIGILPRHEPLLTALSFGELRYKKGDQEFSFAIGGGFMEVRPEKVSVLADSAEYAEEIDAAEAEAARKRAQELLAQKPENEADTLRLERSLRRAEVQLRVAHKQQRRLEQRTE